MKGKQKEINDNKNNIESQPSYTDQVWLSACFVVVFLKYFYYFVQQKAREVGSNNDDADDTDDDDDIKREQDKQCNEVDVSEDSNGIDDDNSDEEEEMEEEVQTVKASLVVNNCQQYNKSVDRSAQNQERINQFTHTNKKVCVCYYMFIVNLI